MIKEARFACCPDCSNNKLIGLINAEYIKASSTHPKFNSSHEGYAILMEEIDELWDEIKKNPNRHPEREENMKKEMIQCAAMCMRFLHDICGVES
ncbi:MAG: hypothetical protein M0Q91_13320 [Methanoregula sp.]|nr:hypothetical protein [Methanoregula sp.]